jgi:uncharacterized protein YycO
MASPSTAPHLRGFQIRRYGPNDSVSTARTAAALAEAVPIAQPGDFILTHSAGIYGGLIRFGEALRYWGKDKLFAHWSHAAIFVDEDGNIIEALGSGVQKRNISVYRGTEYVVVHLPPATVPLDRKEVVDFAEFCLNDDYGWMTIVNIGLCLLTGATFSFGIDGQQICSALVARCLERIGEIFPEAEPWHIMPADLAKHFSVQLTGDKGKSPNPDEGVVRFSRPGKRRR